MDLRRERGFLPWGLPALTFLGKDHSESGLALVTRKASPERGPVYQRRPGVGDLGRLATRDGFALRSDARPGAALRAQPRGVSPQNVSGVAMVRRQRPWEVPKK